MRIRSFAILIIFIVATSIGLLLMGNQHASIESIVSETHKQLNNLKTFKENLENAEEKRLVADDKYLTLLGFTDDPRLYPDSVWKNTSLPIIVTYVLDGQEQQAVGFVRNTGHFLPNHTTVIYNLGLGQSGLLLLQNYCNTSRCVIITYDLSVFPSHVEKETLHAFRPLIIQDALNKAGAVMFLESDYRLISSHLEELIRQASAGTGVLTWSTRLATSSVTHPKMFDYFQTTSESFLFLPMVEVTKLLLLNTEKVHSQLMLPWVQCALTQDCVLPIGAQSEGCRYNKKPQYRYSGCHRYDASALNIVLGLHHGFDDTLYTYRGKNSFFRQVSPDIVAMEMASLEGNSTETTSFIKDSY